MTKRSNFNARPSLPKTLEDFNFISYEYISSKLSPEGVGNSVTYGSTNFLSWDFGVVTLWAGLSCRMSLGLRVGL